MPLTLRQAPYPLKKLIEEIRIIGLANGLLSNHLQYPHPLILHHLWALSPNPLLHPHLPHLPHPLNPREIPAKEHLSIPPLQPLTLDICNCVVLATNIARQVRTHVSTAVDSLLRTRWSFPAPLPLPIPLIVTTPALPSVPPAPMRDNHKAYIPALYHPQLMRVTHRHTPLEHA